MVAADHLPFGADGRARVGRRLETPGVAANRFFLNNTMPFALAGFMEVEQLEPGVYRVKHFARNGQLLERRGQQSSRGWSGQREFRAAGAVVDSVEQQDRQCRKGRLGDAADAPQGTRTAMLKLPGAPVGIPRAHLPDPATPGPYRPFASDPGWSEGGGGWPFQCR